MNVVSASVASTEITSTIYPTSFRDSAQVRIMRPPFLS